MATRSPPPHATSKRWTTCRATSAIDYFASRLDVTDRAAAFRTVRLAHEHFGALDVVVNNAGYGQFGFVEELTEAESRLQIDTNFFGPLWVTQAVLPFMRARGSGHIIQVSSIAGVTAHPNLGIYHASKWALEGLSESLAQEVAPLGINVTIVEPALFKTDWSGSSAKHAQLNAAYADGHRSLRHDDSVKWRPKRANRTQRPLRCCDWSTTTSHPCACSSDPPH